MSWPPDRPGPGLIGEADRAGKLSVSLGSTHMTTTSVSAAATSRSSLACVASHSSHVGVAGVERDRGEKGKHWGEHDRAQMS